MNNDLISILMSEYNTPESYLRESIQSILNQTYENFEFIIIDDCGINDVEKIAKDFNDNRIKVIKNQKNMGFVYSLNHGVIQAKSEYIVRMDTDDISMPNRIEILYEFIQKNPEYDVVGTKAIEFSNNEEYSTIGTSGEKTKKSIMRGDMIVHASAIMKKKSLLKVNLYKNYKRAEDLVLWCELLLSGHRLYTIDAVLYRYRVNRIDYKKRTLKNRVGEIKARLHFYPKMGAGPIEYIRIIKSILAGIAPISIIRLYRNKRTNIK